MRKKVFYPWALCRCRTKSGGRSECLNEHWFLSLRQAKSLIENWRVEYNTDRPHSALGYLTPAQFVQAHQKEGLLPLGSMSVPY
ncbi:integrase core domain-containing protein [Bordetella holmesii]|uniref:integrase core domain-containing protein n=1 Tax=Bordetella holmesii TaxID=35814 RepID=UPI001298889B|nr:integrase core domain-containing protein [Bordetella holmesii]QGE81851.1 transposase [Bordetella holmesii]